MCPAGLQPSAKINSIDNEERKITGWAGCSG
jgi:hypothetical protein